MNKTNMIPALLYKKYTLLYKKYTNCKILKGMSDYIETLGSNRDRRYKRR